MRSKRTIAERQAVKAFVRQSKSAHALQVQVESYLCEGQPYVEVRYPALRQKGIYAVLDNQKVRTVSFAVLRPLS